MFAFSLYYSISRSLSSCGEFLTRKLLIMIYTLLKTGHAFLQAPLAGEANVYFTANRHVRGLRVEIVASLLFWYLLIG